MIVGCLDDIPTALNYESSNSLMMYSFTGNLANGLLVTYHLDYIINGLFRIQQCKNHKTTIK